FIWIATQDGVFRYDGTGFDQYKKTNDEINSLRENFIFDIALGNNDNLYVASFNAGIDVINVRTQKITHLLSQKKEGEEGLPNLWIEKIFCDAENNLWIGGENFLKIYDLDEKKYKDFQQSKGTGPEMHISFIRLIDKNTVAVSVDNYGVLFYSTSSLNILDSITGLEREKNITASDLAIINDSCYLSTGSHLFSGKFQNRTWTAGRKIEITSIRD